jgi:hypothetical protein
MDSAWLKSGVCRALLCTEAARGFVAGFELMALGLVDSHTSSRRMRMNWIPQSAKGVVFGLSKGTT